MGGSSPCSVLESVQPNQKLIMERFMYQDESFERMLKDKADEYRMYPSQQSWENIQKRIRPKNNLFNFKSLGLSAALLLGFAISISDEQTTKNTNSSFVTNFIDDQELPVTEVQSQKNIAKVIPIAAAVRVEQVSAELPETIVTDAIGDEVSELNSQLNAGAGISTDEEMPSLTKATIVIEHNSIAPSINVKTSAEENKEAIAAHQVLPPIEPLADEQLTTNADVPVIAVPKPKRQLQFYILQQDPEKVAKHRPSMGVEFGSAILFPLTKNINFRTGIQLNYTRYNVELYRSNPQVATVIMNNNSGVIQRVTSLSSQNNNGLFKSDEVANETYQLSLPVGLEFKLVGKRNLQWQLATNVQPTYLISASGYLLTSNFEKYIKAPDLLSNLNLNTSLETFLRWKVKDIQLQAGPQLRYQIFSNSQDGYPIKEHLVDYGFRIGIVKTLK
jgi:hypothetical protein